MNKLKEFKGNRDSIKVNKYIGKLVDAADEDENLMPYIIDAVKARVTLGEISDAFEQVFGRYQPKFSF